MGKIFYTLIIILTACTAHILKTSSSPIPQPHQGSWILENLSLSTAFSDHPIAHEFSVDKNGAFTIPKNLESYAYSIFIDQSKGKFVYRRLTTREKMFFKIHIINNTKMMISDVLRSSANDAMLENPSLFFAKRIS